MKTNKINSKTIYLYFKDILGNEKHITISKELLNNAVNCGLMVDGSDIVGITEIFESEFILFPLINKVQFIEVNEQLYCSYKCKVTTTEGIDISSCSNELLDIAIKKAIQFGLIDIYSQKSDSLFKSQKPKLLLSAS
ncbi:MAG: hypothetical protein COS14_06090 [Bacteroidetes bacterium CG02_land_8_20_14_3_00_31_25]|nr:glutamine synthetase [Bacteroidota bacterium]PIV59244.1 MAG: hypothetical protein COS14_06090 [Bacteroidetes bacterium CG02_land_8_20_14_3_00_31_25]PIX34905.1 MAG: hypothetical protein COZ59_07205 [Bacteroidetes bacterium CG_4_8_14_3_um_filter_31_14]